MSARTAGPWEARFYTDGRASLLASVKSDSAIVIADLVMNGHVKPDADFIVLACNAHESLVSQRDALAEALREMLSDAETMNEPYRNEAICERARAALAKDGA